MQSRKRNQGKVRRAKAASASSVEPFKHMDEKLWFPRDHCGCRHGQPTCPPVGHPCRKFLQRFMLIETSAAVVNFVRVAHRENPDVLNDECNCKLLLKFVLSHLAERLLETDKISPGVVLIAMMIENHQRKAHRQNHISETQATDCLHWLKCKDGLDGCGRTLVKYLKERVPCSCLDEKYARLKPQPKTGLCSHCGERKDRKQLKFCTACESVQYCSHQCQALHWQTQHKEVCRAHFLEDSLSITNSFSEDR